MITKENYLREIERISKQKTEWLNSFKEVYAEKNKKRKYKRKIRKHGNTTT